MNGQDETDRTRQRGNRTLEAVFALLLVAGIALPMPKQFHGWQRTGWTCTV